MTSVSRDHQIENMGEDKGVAESRFSVARILRLIGEKLSLDLVCIVK